MQDILIWLNKQIGHFEHNFNVQSMLNTIIIVQSAESRPLHYKKRNSNNFTFLPLVFF